MPICYQASLVASIMFGVKDQVFANPLVWATDLGNAYLEVKTKEILYIIAGPEFRTLDGHILVIYKALYGLRTRGLRWHERFSDCLHQEGFKPCKAEPDIWMRPNGDVYEFFAV